MALRTRQALFGSLAALAIIATAGCGNLGTAVVLWPPEDSRWAPGDLVTVKDESFLRKTYIVNLPNQKRLKEELDQWRLHLFRREKDAAAMASAMGEWREVYVECLYNGLPMRSEPSNTASRIYRFRKGDAAKVLDRQPGPVQVGNLEGYWYRVLAAGGVEGYVFDYHLRVMRISRSGTEVLNAPDVNNPQLNNLIAGAWRPQYFADMVRDRRINLGLFRPEYGLFPDAENKTLHLKLPDVSVSEVWTEIIPAGPNRYDFLGTSFRITVNSADFISVQYNADGAERFEAYIRLGRDIANIVSGEVARRDAVLTSLMENGPRYDSRTYGTLAITEDGRFVWSGKSALISRSILTPEAGRGGMLEFDHFAEAGISTSYEGVLSLRFDSAEVLRFLYAFKDGGLHMLYVPETAIDGGLVRTDQYLNPIRLLFVPIDVEAAGGGTDLPDR